MKDYTHIPDRPANWKPPVKPTPKTRAELWDEWRKDQERASQYQGQHGSYSRTWVEREETRLLIENQSI